MNCQSFGNVVDELARDQIMDASLREHALDHAASCSGCNRSLDEQRALTNQLREFSTAMRSQVTSVALEQSLSESFRNHLAASRNSSTRPAWKPWLYAAAAVLLLAVVSVAVMQFRKDQKLIANDKQQASVPTEQKDSGATPDEPDQKEKEQVKQKPELKPMPRPNKSPRMSPRGVARPKNLEAVASAGPTEITTEFYPLGYSNTDTPDGGQVVRVELSRYAMARFGLPVNMDRYDERVKADVIVGSDGLARAIRFVQ